MLFRQDGRLYLDCAGLAERFLHALKQDDQAHAASPGIHRPSDESYLVELIRKKRIKMAKLIWFFNVAISAT